MIAYFFAQTQVGRDERGRKAHHTATPMSPITMNGPKARLSTKRATRMTNGCILIGMTQITRVAVEWTVEAQNTTPWIRRCGAVATLSNGDRIASSGQSGVQTWDPIQKAAIEINELCSLRDRLRAAGMPIRGLWELTAKRAYSS